MDRSAQVFRPVLTVRPLMLSAGRLTRSRTWCVGLSMLLL